MVIKVNWDHRQFVELETKDELKHRKKIKKRATHYCDL